MSGNYGNNNNRGGYGGKSGGGFRPQYVPNAMDDRKLALTAPPLEGSRIPPNLSFTFPAGNPRATVWTGRETGQGKEKIQAKMDMLDFFRLLEMVKLVVKEDGHEVSYRLELKEPAEAPMNEDGSRGKKGPPQLQSTIVVGRNQKGRIYISVISPNGDLPKIQFFLGQGYYSNIAKKGGEPIPDNEVANLVATAWVNLYEKLMPAAHFHTYKPREKQEGGNGGGGNGGYKRDQPSKSGGDSGGLDPTASGGDSWETDDIPFD